MDFCWLALGKEIRDHELTMKQTWKNLKINLIKQW